MSCGYVVIGLLTFVTMATIQPADYTWRTFYEQSLKQCLHGYNYLHLMRALNRTLHCFSSLWHNCLHYQRISSPSYVSNDLCWKMSLLPPPPTVGKESQYSISMKVHVDYTINVTFIKFILETTPFGCKRNKMEVLSGDHQVQYCGVRDPWSIYSNNSFMTIYFWRYGVDVLFQVELLTTILVIVGDHGKYRILPPEEIDVYRDHPKSQLYEDINKLQTSWDPVLVSTIYSHDFEARYK